MHATLPATTYPRWICCQLGAREHYSIPRALHHAGELRTLITDGWMVPGDWGGRLLGLRRLSDRFHPELAEAPVTAFTPSLLRFEATHRFLHTHRWQRIIARNQWFQSHALATLHHLASHHPHPQILFSYSYAGLRLGQFAKAQGWPFVLGQIDPGLVAEGGWQNAPAEYWEQWLSECDLATTILVNSTWAYDSLSKAGIPEHKLRLVPLVYEPDGAIAPLQQTFQRTYPTAFTRDRPLRVLFLGQAIPRKGILELLEATIALQDAPIEFWIVGPAPADLRAAHPRPNLCWWGDVPRSITHTYYQKADVFLLPTHSDGFAITQLEAQAWQLPIIASPFCGAVVEPNRNGWLLPTVTPGAIATTLRHLLQNPSLLAQAATHSHIPTHHRLPHLQHILHQLTTELQP